MPPQSTRRRSRRRGRAQGARSGDPARAAAAAFFRAPARELPAHALVERVARLLEALGSRTRLDPERAIAAGRLRVAQARVGRAERHVGRPVRHPGEPVAPGTALVLEGVRVPRGPSTGDLAEILVPRLPWRSGQVAADLRFTCVEVRHDVARLRVEGDLHAFRRWLGRAGWPALGDLEMGGVVASSEVAWAAVDRADALVWPEEAPYAGPGRRGRGTPPRFRISRASARALAAGHPWVLADAETDDVGRFARGTCVALEVADSGEGVGTALVDGDGPVAARSFGGMPGDVDARVAASVRRRRALLDAIDAPEGTDAIRLVHGEADGLPGVAADRLGDLLRIQWTGHAALAMRSRIVEALVRTVPGFDPQRTPVVEVTHLREPPSGALEAVAQTRGAALTKASFVREAGLRFRIDPGQTEPTRPRPGVGLFLDQRANRARVAARVRAGGRYLNLFAHTGAFSARLLAAGAGEVWSVDLSAPYLAWLDENLRASGLDLTRHHGVQGDARRFLEARDAAERFDGIILDPPTSAAAGRRFWSVAQGIAPLLEHALARLAPGGLLLACRNDQQGGDLRAPVLAAARAAGVEVTLHGAPPSEDFPTLEGFREGTPFRALLAVARS